MVLHPYTSKKDQARRSSANAGLIPRAFFSKQINNAPRAIRVGLIKVNTCQKRRYAGCSGRVTSKVSAPSLTLLIATPRKGLSGHCARTKLHHLLFAGEPEVGILGHGKDEERNTLSRGTARSKFEWRPHCQQGMRSSQEGTTSAFISLESSTSRYPNASNTVKSLACFARKALAGVASAVQYRCGNKSANDVSFLPNFCGQDIGASSTQTSTNPFG